MALQNDEQKITVPCFRKDALVLIPYYYGCKKTHNRGVSSGVPAKS